MQFFNAALFKTVIYRHYFGNLYDTFAIKNLAACICIETNRIKGLYIHVYIYIYIYIQSNLIIFSLYEFVAVKLCFLN